MWVARDKDENYPFLYLVKPIRNEKFGIWYVSEDYEYPESREMALSANLYPDITWEDEPKEVYLTSVGEKLPMELIEDITTTIIKWDDICTDWRNTYGLMIPISREEYLFDYHNGVIKEWCLSNGWKSYTIEDYVSWKIKTNSSVAHFYKGCLELFASLKSKGDNRVRNIDSYFDVDAFDEKRKDSVYKNFD